MGICFRVFLVTGFLSPPVLSVLSPCFTLADHFPQGEPRHRLRLLCPCGEEGGREGEADGEREGDTQGGAQREAEGARAREGTSSQYVQCTSTTSSVGLLCFLHVPCSSRHPEFSSHVQHIVDSCQCQN